MRIDSIQLQEITKHLFERLRESCGDTVEIDLDYYWEIGSAQKYDPYETPDDFSIGQVSFDMEALQSGLAENMLIAYDLKRLGVVLAAIEAECSATF